MSGASVYGNNAPLYQQPPPPPPHDPYQSQPPSAMNPAPSPPSTYPNAQPLMAGGGASPMMAPAPATGNYAQPMLVVPGPNQGFLPPPVPSNLNVGTPIDTAKVDANSNIKIMLAILFVMLISSIFSAIERFKSAPWLVIAPVCFVVVGVVFARSYKTGNLQFDKQSKRMKADMATAVVIKNNYESSFTELGGVTRESAGYPGASNIVLSTQTGAKIVLETIPTGRSTQEESLWVTYIQSMKDLARQ